MKFKSENIMWLRERERKCVCAGIVVNMADSDNVAKRVAAGFA